MTAAGGETLEERALQIQFPEKFDYALAFQTRQLDVDADTGLLTTEQRLALYALRQQATVGKNPEGAPAFWHAVERAKWGAWDQVGKLSKFEAMAYFVQTLEALLKEKEMPVDWLVQELSHRDAQQPAAAAAAVSSEAPPQPSPERTPVTRDLPLPEPPVSLRPVLDEKEPPQFLPGHTQKQTQRSPPVAPLSRLSSGVAGSEAPGAAAAADIGLQGDAVADFKRQIEVLKFRLHAALRDVDDRDAALRALQSENEQLRALLTTTRAEAAAPTPASPERPPPAAPVAAPAPSRPPAHNPNKKPTSWFQWLAGGESEVPQVSAAPAAASQGTRV